MMLLTLPKVYYESYAVTIRYDEEQSLGMAVWQGKLRSEEIREAILLCGYVVERYGLTRWLADNRKMRAFSPEDQLWILQNAVPQILTGSLRRMATVVSEDVQHTESIAQIVERTGDTANLVLCDFSEQEAAVEWLLQEF
ncbi:hypothetical protein [Rufibacter sp. DG15C]|uniref:hypothetical protein n=1 Tax=Rufibacter sp. DG15C TaxID=1379909 RepID=UPI0012F8D735|nr:hypothetical protein [Rufibacter sp. DG15C]